MVPRFDFARKTKLCDRTFSRIACSRFVRLISNSLRGTRTTGQLSRYKTGQIMNSQQPTRVRLTTCQPIDRLTRSEKGRIESLFGKFSRSLKEGYFEKVRCFYSRRGDYDVES